MQLLHVITTSQVGNLLTNIAVLCFSSHKRLGTQWYGTMMVSALYCRSERQYFHTIPYFNLQTLSSEKKTLAKFGDYRKVCDPKIRLFINSPLLQRDISLFSSDENLLLDQDNNFHLMSLSILTTVWCMMYGYYREKLHVNHFKKFKG